QGQRGRLARHDTAPARHAPSRPLYRTKWPQGKTDRRGRGPGRQGDSVVNRSLTPSEATVPSLERKEVTRLRDLSPQQWKSGLAAWLGWLFDGLDFQLYMLVATPFVTELLGASSPKDRAVTVSISWIQAAFLFGWALGGGFFGHVADRMGRSR